MFLKTLFCILLLFPLAFIPFGEKNKMSKHKSLSLTPFTKANLKLEMIIQSGENNNYYRYTRQEQMLSSVNEIDACKTMKEALRNFRRIFHYQFNILFICRACDPPNTPSQSQELHCNTMYSFTVICK